MDGSREGRTQSSPDTWLFNPRAHVQDPRYRGPSSAKSGPNCPEVSGSKDSLVHSPTWIFQEINLLRAGGFCFMIWLSLYLPVNNSFSRSPDKLLIRMPSHLWQRLRLVHPTPFPPLSGFTVRPHFSGSPAVRLRCCRVTEFCPMNCRQIQ